MLSARTVRCICSIDDMSVCEIAMTSLVSLKKFVRVISILSDRIGIVVIISLNLLDSSLSHSSFHLAFMYLLINVFKSLFWYLTKEEMFWEREKENKDHYSYNNLKDFQKVSISKLSFY